MSKRSQRALALVEEVAVLLGALGGVGVLGGGAIGLWVPELRPFAAVTALIGAVLLVFAAVGSIPRLRRAWSPRRRSALASVAISVAVLAAVAVLVNVTAMNSNVRWDTTASREFGLAPQTLDLLDALPEPVRVTGLFALSQNASVVSQLEAGALLGEFERKSSGRVAFESVDVERRPSAALAFGVNRFPSLAFQTASSESAFVVPADEVTEQLLVTSLLIATGQRQKVVYYLTGHRERDYLDMNAGSDGFGLAARGIALDGYRFVPLNIAESGGVPADANVVVVAAPEVELLPPESTILDRWLITGGRALFLVEPGLPPTFRTLLQGWGIETGDGVVLDPGRSVTGDPATPLLRRGDYARSESDRGPEAIVESLDVTFFPDATSIRLSDQALEGLATGEWPFAYSSLAESSGSSVLLEGDNIAEAKAGPHTLIMAAEGPAPGEGATRRAAIVVLGDSDLVTNRFYHAYTNADVVLNAVSWLAEDFTLVSIRSNPATFRQLIMTRQEFNFARFSAWFALPAIVAIMGIIVWWRRR